MLKAAKTDPKYALEVLQRRYPQRWGRTTRTEVSGRDGAPVQAETRIVIVSGSAAEVELDRLADEEDG